MSLDDDIERACAEVIVRCKCGQIVRRPGQKYCRDCHNAYMREHRPKHRDLPELQRRKANARSYVREYVRRGKIKVMPCSVCGSTENIEAHHPDHEKPLEVVWLCKAHHVEVTNAERDAGALAGIVSNTGEFHVELEEALWLMCDGKSLAEIVGEFRRGIVNLAIKKTGSRREAKKALNISNTTIYRIEQHGNKY